MHLTGAHRAKPKGPLVKWLRHGPFTAVTWVRVPYGSPFVGNPARACQYGGLAQLVRAPASHAGGHWFESSSLHQKGRHPLWNGVLFLCCHAGRETSTKGRKLLAQRALGATVRWTVSFASSAVLSGLMRSAKCAPVQPQKPGLGACSYGTR